jgi:hypothetical protein
MPLDQSGPLLRIAACPQPFSSQRIDLAVPVGLTLAEIVAVAIPDPAWHAHAVVIVGDERAPRAWWPRVRPKAGAMVAVHILPRGGQGWRIASGMVDSRSRQKPIDLTPRPRPAPSAAA